MTGEQSPAQGKRRFGINPGPLKLRGEIPIADPDAGRCQARLKNGSGRCLHEAKWSVTHPPLEDQPRLYCGVHARPWRSHGWTVTPRAA